MSSPSNKTCTVILAGGRGSRMQGQDKGLLDWQGKPLIEHILAALDDDYQPIMINANRNLERYRQYGHQVISDTLDDYQGPLIGLLSAMQHCSQDYILCLPCDSPRPPTELLSRLHRCLSQQQRNSAICFDGQRLQPLFALLACSLQSELQAFLDSGKRKVHDFFHQLDPAICDFSDQPECFHNFNTPDDMQ
ncbi:MAG: molybdenum cofactor guanylyltransferase [Gammaproteobacteria bacterium]|nr:MAG: molybdenum cofactor guanylyltransferase [Gammaproteobacteria bacterium]